MNKPLREHFEVPTDDGSHLRVFDYILALEEYIRHLPIDGGTSFKDL
jgi:hypothetical protein